MRVTQGSFGFVQRRNQIFLGGADQRLGAVGHSRAVHVDAVSDRADLCCRDGAHPASLAARNAFATSVT